MKLQVKKIEMESWTEIVVRLLAVPFLVVAITLFWVIAMLVMALIVGLAAIFDPLFAYLHAPIISGSRMTGSAA